MKKTGKGAKAAAGDTPDTSSPPSPASAEGQALGSVVEDEMIVVPRLTRDECEAIIAAHSDGDGSLGSVVHKLYLFGYRARS